MRNTILILISSIILSLGILGAGVSVGKGIYLIRKMNRIITVKGIAEQDVTSNLGIWEINYRAVGNDLQALDQRLQQDQQVVTTFLKQQGFTDDEIDRTQIKIDDRLANFYNQNPNQSANTERYIITGGIKIRSAKVDLIQRTLRIVDKLLQLGVPLAFDVSSLSPNPTFYYTNLDSIRPNMLASATKSARIVAEQFAKDSGSRLGTIQRASQGVFQIMGRDTSTMSADWNNNQNALGSIDKKVRLVTTIDYRLK